MTYDQLLDEALANSLIVKEKRISGNKGRIKNNRIAIKADMTYAEKKCVLAEELGHHYTGVGDITKQGKHDYYNHKQENQARFYSYNSLIGLAGLIRAFEHGCHSKTEIAEFLEVPEEYLAGAISCYTDKYGIYTAIDNYIIYFIPNLAVGKIF